MDSNTFLAICMVCVAVTNIFANYFNYKRNNKD